MSDHWARRVMAGFGELAAQADRSGLTFAGHAPLAAPNRLQRPDISSAAVGRSQSADKDAAPAPVARRRSGSSGADGTLCVWGRAVEANKNIAGGEEDRRRLRVPMCGRHLEMNDDRVVDLVWKEALR